ncbi:MAG: leucine-rich repeat protein, partial [Firmicutes bacterium]|nr:leucine-rich repeat protein [Bacillota bacterium]
IFLEERTVPPFDLSVNPDPQENHVFKGWCLDPEYTQIYEAVPICEDTFIYARFVRLYVLKVFDGSELMGREMLEEGTKPILDTPFKPGFDFCGWFLDFELMLPYDFAPIYCDITLYVKFEPLPPNKFFVVFMSICGEKLGGYLLEDGEIIYAMDVVPPAGTRFGGWFSSPDCEDEFIFGIGIFEDTAVYLLFIKVYTVSFWAGGEEIAVFTVDEGEIILPVASLSPPDYHEFIGWFEIGESCGAFDFAVLIYRDIALKAVFKRITVTVRFVISEGTKQIATVKAGQTVTAPQNPEDGVCVFMGWYSDRELTALFDFDAPIFEDTEVFASWRQKSIFTVKFFGHDEVLLLCVKVLEFDPVIPPTPPAVKYYTFSYWTESDALSRVTANVSCFSVYVYDSTDPDGFGYVPYRGGYLINSVITMENRLILPVEYDGLPVLGVADTASGILALKSVSFIFIPSSYVYIGKNAFCRASDMELEVEFGKNPQVHYIGDFAFRGVRTDFVPLDVESIGVGAFMYAILARAHMYNIKSIGEFAFAYAYIGELVWYCGLDLPDSVFYYAEITLASFDEFEAMGERAFYAAEITGVLILPSSLKTIGRLAFSLCLLEEIVLPDSVDTIGASVFAKMPNLKKINIPASLLQIAESAFSDCPALTSVTFAKASLLAGIGASAFKNTAIAGIALPGTVTRIEGFAFSSSALTGIKLPMFLATLDFCAFEDCGSLQNITIPSDSLNLNFVNSDYLNYATFGGFVVESGNRYFSARGDIHLYDLGGERLVVFIDCQSYACPASLKLIESRAFMGKTALKVVKISEKVVSIGDYAFAGSQAAPMNLIAVDFSDAASLAYIGEGAFMYNTALIQADLAGCSSLISLPKDCFFGASGLNLIKLPAQIKMIGENAFAFDSATGSGIAALDLTQYTSLEEIKTDAFANRTGLIEVKFPSSLKVLSGFNGCTNLANAVFADGTIEIGAYAFFGCILSDAFTVPDSVKSIGEFAFAHSGITVFAPTAAFSGLGAGAFSCSRLTSVDLSWTSLVAIGAHAFLGAGGLKTVVFPAGLERIGELAFAQTDLMEVGLPPSVEIVGGGAFMGCKGLTDVYFGNSAGGSELSIFDITPFEGCSKLKNIYIFALKPPMLIAPALGIANTGGPEYGKLADLKIFVPSGCLEAYKNADYFGQSCWQFHLDRLYEMP